MRVDEVPVFSFAQLVEKYNVRSIGAYFDGHMHGMRVHVFTRSAYGKRWATAV